MNEQKVYIVNIVTGYGSEMNVHTMFVTHDIKKAKYWVRKYNTIVRNNKDRISNIFYNSDNRLMNGHYADYIYYREPVAEFEQIELR